MTTPASEGRRRGMAPGSIRLAVLSTAVPVNRARVLMKGAVRRLHPPAGVE